MLLYALEKTTSLGYNLVYNRAVMLMPAMLLKTSNYSTFKQKGPSTLLYALKKQPNYIETIASTTDTFNGYQIYSY